MASSVASSSSSSSSSSSISKSKCKYYVYSKCTRGGECRFQHINCKYADKCKIKACTYGHPPKVTKSVLHHHPGMPIVIQSQSVSKIEKEMVTESKQMSPSPSSNDLTKGSVEASKPVKKRHRKTPNEKTASVTPLSEADAATAEKNDLSKKKAQLMKSLQKQVLDLSRATNILPRNFVSPTEAETQNKQEPTTVEATTSTSTSTSTSTASTLTYWKKGTGYGFDSQTDTWHEYVASQQNRTTAISIALNAIASILTQSDADDDMYGVLEQSCVLPVLSHFLKNDSITDIQQQASLYTSIFSFIDILTKPSTIQLFNITLNDSHTLLHHLESLHSRALMTHKFEKLGSHVDADAETEQDKSIIPQIVNMMTKVEEARNKLAKISEADSTSSSLAVESPSIPLSKAESIAPIAQDTKKETAAGPSVSDYVKIMSELRMGQIEKFTSHCYYNESDSNSYRRPWIKRLATEYTDLAQSLPITVDSSVFLRVHESSMAYAQMLIIAPDNTPYGRGCFLFDVAFPPTYPNTPPHVNLQTTGHGSVRFNPNLYECGKVCLSLLGTWSGSHGESWNPQTSTFLQVGVSIQSLIFVPEPYFNEPGYESSIGTPEGDESSKSYNDNIRAQTIRWAMIDMMQHPPPGFEQIIRVHFFVHKDAIMKQCEEWSKSTTDVDESLLAELKAELDKVEATWKTTDEPAVSAASPDTKSD